MADDKKLETAFFGGGCFWCTEAIFRRLKGVSKVVSGYAGGTGENPTYEEVSTGKTGYTEAVKITFDPQVISYTTLLAIFWVTHDPTTKDRQGYDVGSQYRSVIYYMDKKQEHDALVSKEKVAKQYPKPVVTEIRPFTTFVQAEGYHQEYYDNNQGAPYCNLIIDPKVQKLIKEFANDIKDEYK